MGNRVSTARKLGKTVSSESSINRSSVNQLPSEALKEKFARGPQEPTKESQTVPEGKDGRDPQEQDMIKYMTQLGSKIQTKSQVNKPKLDPISINQLKNRNMLYKRGEELKSMQFKKNSTMVDPKELTAIIEDLHDPTYENNNIIERFNLDKDFLNNLTRFKIAKNFQVLEEAVKEDEVGHQGILPQKTLDSEMPVHSDDSSSVLRDRISVDK